MAESAKKKKKKVDTKSSKNTQSKKMSAREKEKKKRGKIILFIVEIFILLIMVAVLYAVLKVEKVGKVDLNEEKLVINEEVKERAETTKMKGYRNIALFGVDSTTGALAKNTRSDTIMIASINLDTGDCKLVSVYRDTYLNLSNDTYNKCNAAYMKGGPEMAINMLNMNLDMDIEHFVTVGYKGLSEVIDGLGGVWIDVDEEELKHINNYQINIAETLKCDYVPVTSAGYQLLDGLQATAYCRIRYTAGDDFKRTARQREVLQAIEDQAKQADLATLTKVFNNAIDDIYTNIDTETILTFLDKISTYEIVDEGGFPQESMRTVANIGAKGSSVIPLDLESNVIWLHQFLFDDKDYTVTDSVRMYGDEIASQTAPYINKN